MVALRAVTFDYGFPADLREQFKTAIEETVAENPRDGESSRGYKAPEIEAAWSIAVQPGFPNGGSIVEGTCVDRPSSESTRMDWHVLVFRVGNLPPRKLTEFNCHPRDIAVYDFGRTNAVHVFLNGGNWRSGTTLWILEWRLDTGELETLINVGGDEDSNQTGYRLEIDLAPGLTLYGVVKALAFQDDVDRLSSRLGIPVRMGPCVQDR